MHRKLIPSGTGWALYMPKDVLKLFHCHFHFYINLEITNYVVANIYAKTVSYAILSQLLSSFNNKNSGLTAFCYQNVNIEKMKKQKRLQNVKTKRDKC